MANHIEMADIDEYMRVSNYLAKTLIKLSNEKQQDKYAILAELYKFIFGVPLEGDQEHYILPLEKVSANRPRQAKMDHEQIRFLLIGGDPPVEDPDASQKAPAYILGLCQLCEIKLGIFDIRKWSKRSSEISLIIIHKMLLDANYNHREECQDEFTSFSASMEVYPQMSLDKHFMNHVLGRFLTIPYNGNTELKPNFAIEVIHVLKSVRKTMQFSEILSKDKYQPQIERELEATKAAMQSRLNQLSAMGPRYDDSEF